MTYARIYDSLIARAQHRTLEGYVEKHHIIPKCLGGDNSKSNIVKLTAEEHFIAHLLLLRIHPKKHRLAVAMFMMARRAGKVLTNKLFGELKRRAAENKRGKRHTEETKAKISKLKKGQPSPNKGKPVSEEQKMKISLANKGKVSPNKGKTLTDAQKLHLAKCNLGKTHSEETKLNMSKSRRGKVLGPVPEERKARIAASLKGRKLPPESRAKQIESIKRTLKSKRERKEMLMLWSPL